MPEYAWIIPEYIWLCLNMPEYTGICVNMPKSAWLAFVLDLLIAIPCLPERVVTYFNYSHKKRKDEKFNVLMKFIVWVNMRLFS